MSAPLRVGLVGCGRLAEIGYGPALAAARGVELVAVADPDSARRSSFGVAGFPDAASLLADASVDALVLATPAEHHVADAALAVEAGVPVLVEKPPAPDADGAARLAALGPTVRVGFNRRFDRGVQRVRAAVPARGPLELRLEIRYRLEGWSPHTVRDDALADLGPHLVDLARLLGGEVLEVITASTSPHRADVKLRLARGRATLVADMQSIHREVVEVADTGGRVLAAHQVGGVVAGVLGRVRRGGPHPLVASLTAELESFARAVGGADEPLLGTAADGVAVMETIDAARACAAGDGRAVAVEVS